MNTFAVVGAGFSGTVAAIEFLNRVHHEAQLLIINRSGLIARGLAYGTNSPLHLLNVPAGNMTALADEPDSFLNYCLERNMEVTASSFVSRKVYGDYLEHLLNQAIERSSPRVKTTQINAEVVSLTPNGRGATIQLDSGKTFTADQVTLAFGHFPPSTPSGLGSVSETHYYQQDPWEQRADTKIQKDEPILLIGGGLTAIDVISNLMKSKHTGKVYMLSRRGLLPKPHRLARGQHTDHTNTRYRLLESKPSIRSYLKIIRNAIEAGLNEQIDWRDIIASIRPVTAELWKRLPDSERRRFLRHLQSYWDVHRHRVAPETFLIFEDALNRGQLIPLAGRIISMDVVNGCVTAVIKERRKESSRLLTVNLVVNCTGPTSNPEKTASPLITKLLKEGLVVSDTLRLGVCVNDHYYLKNTQGEPSDWLSYVGPMLKADHWELTAVPELRVAARSVALNVCQKFAR
ncbi:Pyridine nucleotide-disulfide family oxidoreductase [Pseudomonas sp. IT-347P]|uniref:FAD/NAD(P)-binding protein n=1 Tax=Pseudomonas sp. IT-347P TaxID=3026458 RepID=UPI0039DF7538